MAVTELDFMAQRAVLKQLELAYERHSVAEQVAMEGGDAELATDLHEIAVRVLRARMCEEDDKKPQPLPMHCLNCAAAYAAGGK